MLREKWCIVGLGWLGSALATHLTESGIEFWGTNRKNFEWGRDPFPSQVCDVLFLNTPPLTNLSPLEFVNNMTPQDGKIIFISSIGVYGDILGTINERSFPMPVTKNGVWLLEVEKLLLSRFKSQVTIIRAAGLIGGDRHPVYSLTKKTNVPIPDGVVNLIHRKDLLSIIQAISQLEEAPSIVNAVAPFHSLKSEYYQSWCVKLGLGPLKFSSEAATIKIIESIELNAIHTHWHYPELDTL